MSAASLDTSVPLIPMATPMSAWRSAGASLTPSPVIATMRSSCWSASTMRSFCSGDTRANTDRVRTVARNASSSCAASSAPVDADARVARGRRSLHCRRAPATRCRVLHRSGGGSWMVAGDHDHPDARSLRLGDRVDHFGSRRVEDADDAEVDEVVLDRLVDGFGDLVETSVRPPPACAALRRPSRRPGRGSSHGVRESAGPRRRRRARMRNVRAGRREHPWWSQRTLHGRGGGVHRRRCCRRRPPSSACVPT